MLQLAMKWLKKADYWYCVVNTLIESLIPLFNTQGLLLG